MRALKNEISSELFLTEVRNPVASLNEQTRHRMKSGSPHYRFVNDDGAYAVLEPAKPAQGVALDESKLKRTLEENNLVMSELIYGHWDGRSPAPIHSMHDAFIAIKQ